MIIYALDLETYYDRDCSIKKLGPLGYFSHHSFDAYMVSVVGDDGLEWVGHPKDFDWQLLEGQTVLSHNASFDETLYLYGVTKGWWPKVEPAEWHCTADMAAACGLPRSLKNSTAVAFDLEISKSTRDNMSGKTWDGMSEDFKREVEEYAIKDSVLCLRLWKAYESKWSQFERDISVLNRRIVQRGIPIDIDALRKAKETINALLFETEKAIPWGDEKPLLSRKAFDEECIKMGIEPPASLAKTDVDAQRWIRTHGHKYKWIESVTNWRRVNAIKKKLDSFEYATMPDDRYYGGIMYFGGHTGRFSGSGGNLNLQNLPRDEMFGVNMRNLITAPKGRKLVVVDLSQIEVRTLCWLSKDRETMDAIQASDDIYEAFAIQFGLWSKEQGVLKKEDAKLRHKVKALVLGCGYGAGAKRFAEMYDMPLEEAEEAVDLYRERLHKVPRFWNNLDLRIKGAMSDRVLKLKLPSGRTLTYSKLEEILNRGRSNYLCRINRNGQLRKMNLWGGVLAENMSQALARDIFSHMMLEIDKAGIDIIFHVHDEVICECDEDKAEEILQKIIKIMSTPPEWIPDIPLDAEGEILTKYQK
jgi:DNA polymerase